MMHARIGVKLMVALALVVAVTLAEVDLCMVAYNVQSFPNLMQKTLYLPNQGRIEYIPDQVQKAALDQFDQEPDIICFMEAFSSDFLQIATDFAGKHGYEIAGPNRASIWRGQLVNNGLIILSKSPLQHIEYHDYHVATACGFDRFAAKGFIYAETVKDGVRIGIVATHLQAEDSLCKSKQESAAVVARRKQLQQLAEIQAFLENLPCSCRAPVDALFLVGDLNLSALDLSVNPPAINWDKVGPLLSGIGAQPMTMVSARGWSPPRASYEPASNRYFQRLRKNPLPEHIDFVLALGETAFDVRNMIVPIRDAGFDLSDHHSVMAYTQIWPAGGRCCHRRPAAAAVASAAAVAPCSGSVAHCTQ